MPDTPFVDIDHVQLAMPPGGEQTARRFFCDLLGMKKMTKPAQLAKRGGCWFASGNVQIHLGVEDDFRPARKAHSALRCRDYASLVARISAHMGWRWSRPRTYRVSGAATASTRLEIESN